MRKAVAGAFVLFAALASVACPAPGPQFQDTTGQDTVRVTMRCDGDVLTATVKPYSLNVKEKHGVDWVLDDASNVEEIEIREKASTKWPYDGQPYKAKKNAPGKADKVKTDPKGDYGYTISTVCDLNGKKKTIVIDPDIIIIWN